MSYTSHKQEFASSLLISKENSSLVQSLFAFESFSFLLTIFALSFLFCLWPSLLFIFWGTPQVVDIRMSIKTLNTNSTAYVLHSTQWWKTKCWTKLYSFVFFFSFFINFLSFQMYPTFRPTSKIYNVGWNVGCICVSL